MKTINIVLIEILQENKSFLLFLSLVLAKAVLTKHLSDNIPLILRYVFSTIISAI